MDFSQFLLNESYTLSPYKICVASFICSYLEHRNYVDMLPYDLPPSSSSMLDVSVHGYLTYKLITSIDSSYEELMARINDDSGTKVSNDVLTIFQKEMTRFRRNDMRHFCDFFEKVRSLVQKKFYKSRSSFFMGYKTSGISLSSNQINKLSLTGVFLRKLIIHYERMSYVETSTLFDQLQNYLNGTCEEQSIDDSLDDNQTVDDNPTKSEWEDLKSKIDLKIIDEIESKLNSYSAEPKSFQQVSCRKLLKFIQKVRNELESTQTGHKRKFSETATESIPMDYSTEVQQQPVPSETSMDIDVTLNDMSLDQSVFDHRPKSFHKDDSTVMDTDSILENHPKSRSIKVGNKKSLINSDVSQHFLIKQIYKIQCNEKMAMKPEQVMRYIQKKFSEHNSFYYFLFINYNYLVNSNYVFEQNGGQNAIDVGTQDPSSHHTMANGGTMPNVNTDNVVRNNIAGNNQIGQGGTAPTAAMIHHGPIPAGAIPLNSLITGHSGTSSGLGPDSSSHSMIAIDSLNKKYKSLFRSINFFNDIEYLKFINALRVNNYTLARKYFFDYFDLKKASFEPEPSNSNGSLSSDNPNGNSSWPGGNRDGANHHNHHHFSGNRSGGVGDPSGRNSDGKSLCGTTLSSNRGNYCWSALNLAMMYAHFRYYRLAYDALVDCLSLAREKRDERCLQYAMLWILQISQHLDHSKTKANKNRNDRNGNSSGRKIYADLDLMENIVKLLLSNPMTLSYIYAKAFLHFHRLRYLRPANSTFSHMTLPSQKKQFSLSDLLDGNRNSSPPFSALPFYLAIKHHLHDVLGETFSTYSALLNAYGATHMSTVWALLWLQLDVLNTVMDEQVFFLDENTPIAIRNLAFYLSAIRGEHQEACDLIENFKKHFSKYDQRPQQILERALNEIMFRRYLTIGEWNAASRCLNLVRCIDRTQSLMMLAELRKRQNESLAALECLDMIMVNSVTSSSSVTKLSGSRFFRRQNQQYYDSMDDSGNQEDSVIIPEQAKKQTDNKQERIRNATSRPIFLNKNHLNNLSFYERIQPPPPDELEPEPERPLVPELDPYRYVECQLLRGTILGDLSTLFECISKSLTYGFKQLECRALIQVARLQSEVYHQHNDAIEIMNAIIHRLFSQAILTDIASGLLVYAGVLYRIKRSQPEKEGKRTNNNNNNGIMGLNLLFNSINIYQKSSSSSSSSVLDIAIIFAKRSIAINEYIKDLIGLKESLTMAALIEHDRENISERNFYSKRARMIRIKEM